MSPLFSDRTALVTGGSRGIGRAICWTLAEHGARVAINYRHNETGARETLRLVEQAGGEGMIRKADVSREDEVAGMIADIRNRLGPVELLVNNAGVVETVTHEKITFDNWKNMFAVNMDGPFLTTWAVKDEMIARQYGRIVNISSLSGVVGKDNHIHYGTAKAALISFTKHCAVAFAPHNIRVNCVAPGLTNTDMAQNADPALLDQIIAKTPMARIGEPEEIASVVKFLLSDDASFVTGQTVVVCGGRT